MVDLSSFPSPKSIFVFESKEHQPPSPVLNLVSSFQLVSNIILIAFFCIG